MKTGYLKRKFFPPLYSKINPLYEEQLQQEFGFRSKIKPGPLGKSLEYAHPWPRF